MIKNVLKIGLLMALAVQIYGYPGAVSRDCPVNMLLVKESFCMEWTEVPRWFHTVGIHEYSLKGGTVLERVYSNYGPSPGMLGVRPKQMHPKYWVNNPKFLSDGGAYFVKTWCLRAGKEWPVPAAFITKGVHGVHYWYRDDLNDVSVRVTTANPRSCNLTKWGVEDWDIYSET